MRTGSTMAWLGLAALLCLSPLAAQDDSALRAALRERDAEIQRLQRLLAEKDIELAQLRRTLDDIRLMLDMAPVGHNPVQNPSSQQPDPDQLPTPEPGFQPEVQPAPGPASNQNMDAWVDDLSAKGELTRERAINELAAMGEAVLPQLENVVAMGSLTARRSAVVLIGKIGSPRGVPLLENALQDSDAKVRLWAVGSLGEIDAHSSSLALIESLNDADPAVKMTAALLLNDRHGQELDEDIGAWRDWAAAQGMER